MNHLRLIDSNQERFSMRHLSDTPLEILKQYDQIFLGAVGIPELVPDYISLWGLLIKIRRGLKQSINVRPAKLLAGLESPLKNPENFDITVVRENSEGEYSDSGGRMHSGADEIAIQNAVFTRKGLRERCVTHLN